MCEGQKKIKKYHLYVCTENGDMNYEKTSFKKGLLRNHSVIYLCSLCRISPKTVELAQPIGATFKTHAKVKVCASLRHKSASLHAYDKNKTILTK